MGRSTATRYFLLYKPYMVVSQFTVEHPGQLTLASFGPFPSDVYPVGRLDQDSEGLLLLTNDNQLKNSLLGPGSTIEKVYLAQVEGRPEDVDLAPLRQGIPIQIRQRTVRLLPASCQRIGDPGLPERVPPVRFRKTIPDSWVQVRLREGRNRQVRRMLASVGFPVLRLVRERIGGLTLKGLSPGEFREVGIAEIRDAFPRLLP